MGFSERVQMSVSNRTELNYESAIEEEIGSFFLTHSFPHWMSCGVYVIVSATCPV